MTANLAKVLDRVPKILTPWKLKKCRVTGNAEKENT